MIKIDVLKREIEKNLDTLKVVSFDVFDTLLIRLIPTETVSMLAAEKLSISLAEEIARTISTNDILQHRFSFQQKNERLKREWCLSEWLSDLALKNNIDIVLLKRIGCDAELEAERQSLRIDYNANHAINMVKEYGLKVIALSDMWLDQELLKKLLLSFDMSFDMVFSSATSACSKKSGQIFKGVTRQVGVAQNEILHIGNKFRADYLSSKLCGWNSIWMPHWHSLFRMNVPPKLKKILHTKKPFEEIIQALEIRSCRIEPDPFYALAYNYLSSILIIFSIIQWRRFRSQGINTVLYLARDAYLMMEAYNLIEDLLKGSPKRHYIRLSRRAIAMAHPHNLLLNVEPLAGKIGKKTIGEWLSNFVLDDELYKNILIDSGLKSESPFNDNERIILRKTCQKFQHVIEASQQDQISLISEYIRSQTIGSSLDRVGIIDTGWACTIQDSIRRVLTDETHIVSGIYLGVSDQGKRPDQHNLKYGVLRDDFRRCQYHNPIESTAGVVRMWDTILREPCGSVVNFYRRSDGKVYPMMDGGKVIGDIEQKAAESIKQGILDGVNARKKGVSLIVELSEQFYETEFESAATSISRRISTHPNKIISQSIIRLGFDEGAKGGSKGSLGGIQAMMDRVAWYPGIIACLGLGFTSHLMKMIAGMIMKINNK